MSKYLFLHLWYVRSFFLFQGSESMFSYRKADLADQRKKNILLLRQEGEVITPHNTQWTGLSLLTEAACPAIRLHHPCPPHPDEGPTLTAATVSEMATMWWITTRNSERVPTTQWATMTGGPSLHRLLLPRAWSESVSEWDPSTRMSVVQSLRRRRLPPPWPGTAAPSDEPRHRCLRLHPLVMATPMNGPTSPLSPGLRCTRPRGPGSNSQRECRCRLHLLDTPAISLGEWLIQGKSCAGAPGRCQFILSRLAWEMLGLKRMTAIGQRPGRGQFGNIPLKRSPPQDVSLLADLVLSKTLSDH